jgi:hypothetical protein
MAQDQQHAVRVPGWVLVVAAAVFTGPGVWSLTDRNWAGGVVCAALAVACLVSTYRSSREA